MDDNIPSRTTNQQFNPAYSGGSGNKLPIDQKVVSEYGMNMPNIGMINIAAFGSAPAQPPRGEKVSITAGAFKPVTSLKDARSAANPSIRSDSVAKSDISMSKTTQGPKSKADSLEKDLLSNKRMPAKKDITKSKHSYTFKNDGLNDSDSDDDGEDDEEDPDLALFQNNLNKKKNSMSPKPAGIGATQPERKSSKIEMVEETKDVKHDTGGQTSGSASKAKSGELALGIVSKPGIVFESITLPKTNAEPKQNNLLTRENLVKLEDKGEQLPSGVKRANKERQSDEDLGKS
jgi:hypothetical protein